MTQAEYTAQQLKEIRSALEKRIADVKLTVHETLVQRGDTSPFISKEKAYRVYGRKTVSNWIKWGLLLEVKDGDNNSKTRLEVARLIALSERMSRCEFYQHERESEI
jgi:hypothetical protein bfra3_11606